jgi:hypothetical protein
VIQAIKIQHDVDASRGRKNYSFHLTTQSEKTKKGKIWKKTKKERFLSVGEPLGM